MEILRISKSDLDKDNYYKLGFIERDENFGYVVFGEGIYIQVIEGKIVNLTPLNL